MLAAWTAGCGGGGGGGGASEFRVVSFLPDGTDGVVFRDQPLIIDFSAPIDPETVSVTALQVVSGGEIIDGRVEVEERRITWFPVVFPGDPNDYVPNNNPQLNGFGFEARGRYTVRMIANSPFSIMSRQGRPLSADFQSSFITSDEFLPEDPPIPPRVLTEVQPAYSPAPLVDGDPYSTNPDDWPVFEPRDFAIEIPMSERILPSTLQPFETVTLRNITEITRRGGEEGEPGDVPAGVGEIALIDLKTSLLGDKIVIENIVSLGDLPFSDQPYLFEIELTTRVTDVARNPLDRAVKLHFYTADRPGEPNHAIFRETFETTDFEDAARTSAKWGPDVLEGADISRRLDTYIPMPQSRFNLPQPLVEAGNPITPFGCRFLMRFEPSHVPIQAGESISGLAWAPRSGFGFQSTYRNIVMKLGQYAGSELGPMSIIFDTNFNPPGTVVFSGDYTVSFETNADWIEWPEFRTDFQYDDASGLLLEVDMPEGGDTFQLFRNRSNGNFQTYRMFANGGAPRRATPNENTQYNTRFEFVSKESRAISLPYSTEQVGADFGGFLVVSRERPGTRIIPKFAGAGDGAPPPLERFGEDIDGADGFSQISFLLELVADAGTGLAPLIESVNIAYVVPDN